MIDSVLGSLKLNMCLCYLDDIVVYAPTFEEHLRRLQLVLRCIQKVGISLNHKKCLFVSRRIKILGHLVDANGIHPDPDKVEAVSKFPRPRQKDPSDRLARWALKLQEFIVTVTYTSGRKHKDADCLPRSPLENDQPSAVTSLTNVDIEQTKDPDLAKIIDNLNSGYTRKEFSIIDGILYKKNYSITGRPWLMIIPRHLRSEVMAYLHDAHTVEHLGFARTYDKVKNRFYWPGLYRTVRQYVSNCRECQRRKKLPRRPAGQLEATGYTPFFLVHALEAETYIDALLPYLPDEISDDYVGELVTRAEEAHQLSPSRLLQSQAKDRRLYDQKHTPVYYQKDDLMWVFTPIRKVGLSEKLLKRNFGPYKLQRHDVILGWDFLVSPSAIIDCGQSEISFSEMPNEDPSVARLYLASDDIIPPKSIKRPQEVCPIVEANENYVSKGVESTYKMRDNVRVEHSPRGSVSEIKDCLDVKTVLGHFDDDAPTELHTDASGYGIGAVLAQKQGSDEKGGRDDPRHYLPYSSSPEGEEFIQNLGTRAEETRQIARHHIFKAQETNKTNYDARHTGKIYEPGDLVWIFIPIRRVGFSEKLLRRYFGPFRVTKKISDVTYEVEAVSEQGRIQKKRDTVHILRMKPYYDPLSQEDSSSVDNSTSGEEEELR
ncbi:hypothetical protein LAZ67_13001456 [Cordylochernes scorpioides]|uniref:RNA-directed DNA polymerase n=1 Tax=Cordylochernes scorpioides TaxID=51811 RepID=A0ABY6L3V1_9ARAC|nr:hypothetical protein LAZ67_13001456 [Cordylochernes scorpioides]